MAVGHESLKFRKINDEWQQARGRMILRAKRRSSLHDLEMVYRLRQCRATENKV